MPSFAAHGGNGLRDPVSSLPLTTPAEAARLVRSAAFDHALRAAGQPTSATDHRSSSSTSMKCSAAVEGSKPPVFRRLHGETPKSAMHSAGPAAETVPVILFAAAITRHPMLSHVSEQAAGVASMTARTTAATAVGGSGDASRQRALLLLSWHHLYVFPESAPDEEEGGDMCDLSSPSSTLAIPLASIAKLYQFSYSTPSPSTTTTTATAHGSVQMNGHHSPPPPSPSRARTPSPLNMLWATLPDWTTTTTTTTTATTAAADAGSASRLAYFGFRLCEETSTTGGDGGASFNSEGHSSGAAAAAAFARVLRLLVFLSELRVAAGSMSLSGLSSGGGGGGSCQSGSLARQAALSRLLDADMALFVEAVQLEGMATATAEDPSSSLLRPAAEAVTFTPTASQFPSDGAAGDGGDGAFVVFARLEDISVTYCFSSDLNTANLSAAGQTGGVGPFGVIPPIPRVALTAARDTERLHQSLLGSNSSSSTAALPPPTRQRMFQPRGGSHGEAGGDDDSGGTTTTTQPLASAEAVRSLLRCARDAPIRVPSALITDTQALRYRPEIHHTAPSAAAPVDRIGGGGGGSDGTRGHRELLAPTDYASLSSAAALPGP